MVHKKVKKHFAIGAPAAASTPAAVSSGSAAPAGGGSTSGTGSGVIRQPEERGDILAVQRMNDNALANPAIMNENALAGGNGKILMGTGLTVTGDRIVKRELGDPMEGDSTIEETAEPDPAEAPKRYLGLTKAQWLVGGSALVALALLVWTIKK